MISKEEAREVWARQTPAREDTKALKEYTFEPSEQIGCGTTAKNQDIFLDPNTWIPQPNIYTPVKVVQEVKENKELDITPLSATDLYQIGDLLGFVEDIAGVADDVEIRVKIRPGSNVWAVLGFSDHGPALLRFES